MVKNIVILYKLSNNILLDLKVLIFSVIFLYNKSDDFNSIDKLIFIILFIFNLLTYIPCVIYLFYNCFSITSTNSSLIVRSILENCFIMNSRYLLNDFIANLK